MLIGATVWVRVDSVERQTMEEYLPSVMCVQIQNARYLAAVQSLYFSNPFKVLTCMTHASYLKKKILVIDINLICTFNRNMPRMLVTRLILVATHVEG